VLLPERIALASAVISPQGDRIVFSGLDQTGRSQLWIRPLDSETATRLAGTEGGVVPFWSPDGTQIGFVADKTLKRVDTARGTLVTLAQIDGTGGTWAPGGDILVGGPSGPIMRGIATATKPSGRRIVSRARSSGRWDGASSTSTVLGDRRSPRAART
jgi:hypothetical protein